MFLALQKFDLKEDLGFNHAGIYKKLEIIPGFHLYIIEINSKYQSSFFFSLEVDLIMLLAILKRLKSFNWFLSCLEIIEFTGRWSCCNMLTWNTTIILLIGKKFPFDYLLGSLYYISTQPFSTTCKHYDEMISQGIGKCVACTPCLKRHVQNKLTGLRRLYVGIGSLLCTIN